MFGNSRPPVARNTLRVLSAVLGYPSAELRGHAAQMRAALHQEQALSAARLAELDALLVALERRTLLDSEEQYVALFDHGRATSLHLFEHVHGDSRDRGPAMIDLAQTFEKAGLYLAEGELPDYLPAVLEFVSTQPPAQARDFLAEMAHILNAIFNALQQQHSAYASVLGALLDLAGEKASAVKVAPEDDLDQSWAEPPVFDGCSSKGQARPGEPQPIHIQRPARATPSNERQGVAS